jgi:DNA-binding transcriptional regulator YbjK
MHGIVRSPEPGRQEGSCRIAAEETIDTRQRILRATLQLIGEQGIGAVSNRRVAAAAGVALGSLTYHFPSQTQLLRDSLLAHVADEVARLEQIAADIRASATKAEQVAIEVEKMARRAATSYEPIAELELHLHAARDPELQDASRRCFEAYEDFAAASLEALGAAEPSRHARAVVTLITGTTVRRLGTGDLDAPGTADALLTLLKGAAARTPLDQRG